MSETTTASLQHDHVAGAHPAANVSQNSSGAVSSEDVRAWTKGLPPAHFEGFKWCPLCREPLALFDICGRVRLGCTGKDCLYVRWDGPSPVALAIVLINGRIVLVRRGVPPCKGSWCLPGGFIEADESGDDAAIREFCEEAGMKVRVVKILGAYTPCYDTNEVILVYLAEVVDGVLAHGDDADAAETFSLEDLPENIAFPEHRKIIEDYLRFGELRSAIADCKQH
ncbi:MAG TPA: NUDIX hydrolase [Chroococcales cyanobacterium]